jgi:WD40 repeat protein/transcriptional regulator with XRE-family HTH domain
VAEPPVLGFAGLLRQLRVQASLTQEELARAAGVSPRSVSDLERGINRTARKETAELLAGALNLGEPVRALFVAAARGRAPAAEVLAAAQALVLSAGQSSQPVPQDRAAPQDPGAAAGPQWSGCPYLGLVPFGEDEARVFYGRDELAARLLGRLAGTGILLLAGESGAGKSSLLRAGLLPLLAAGALGPGSQDWPRLVIRPTSRPLRELAARLADLSGAEPDSMYRSLSAAPGEAPMLIELAVRTAAARGAAPGPVPETAVPEALAPRLVLIVDQLEELFTAGEDASAGQAEREAFIAVLHAAATVPAGPHKLPPALVIAAVRADFLGRLIAYPPLKSALENGPFTVGPMSEAELRFAITGPAAEAGLAVELALVEAVLAELREGAGHEPASGALPLISQAMAATWEHREESELTLRAYRRAGGVADAVNRSAQAAYDALTSRQKGAARLVFTQLTVITPEGQFARRRCSRAELHLPGPKLAADIDAVIDSFAVHRLLVLGTGSVEISHDILLQAWRQFRDWLGDDQLDRALYSQVITDARTWDLNRRDSSYLYQPGRLATIDAAAARWKDAPTRYPPLAATSEAFLRTAHRAASRSTRWRRAVIAGLAALTLIAVGAAGIAVHDEAIAAHDEAIAAQQQAIALSSQLTTESFVIASYEPLTARRLAVAAWRVAATPQAMDAMAGLLTEQQQEGMLPGDPADRGVRAVAFSPSGGVLASGYGDGTVRLWDLATGQAAGDVAVAGAGPGGAVTGLAFSPDGAVLASVDAAGTVRLRDLRTGRTVGTLDPAGLSAETVTAVAFGPDGKLLASADADGTVRLWSAVTGRPAGAVLRAGSGPGGVTAVAFSPDGKLLASTDAAGTVRLWSAATGLPASPVLRTGTAPGGVTAVSFSPDGTLLAIGDADGTVRLWDRSAGQLMGSPHLAGTGSGNSVNAVAFSPSGQLLASADADGTVRLWDWSTGQAPDAPLQADDFVGGVSGVAFGPSGQLLASADANGVVRLWNLATGRAGHVLQAEKGAPTGVTQEEVSLDVRAVAFSPNGMLVVTADPDGTVRLWSVVTGRQVGGALPAGNGARGVTGVAFSPDGQRLASADANGTVRLWKMTGRAVGAPLLTLASSRGVNGIAFSPDGQLLATANMDGTVRLWDPATGRAVGAPLPADRGPGGGVTAVAFSPDDQLLASADANGRVRLWDLATRQPQGAPLAADTGPGGGVTAVAFSPDGKLLASADADGTVRLWDPLTGQPEGAPLIVDLGHTVTGVAFSRDGSLLAASDGDGYVRAWQIAPLTDPYAALCADVGAPTQADWARYFPGQQHPQVC